MVRPLREIRLGLGKIQDCERATAPPFVCQVHRLEARVVRQDPQDAVVLGSRFQGFLDCESFAGDLQMFVFFNGDKLTIEDAVAEFGIFLVHFKQGIL